MNFRSDNTAPVAAEILAAIADANDGAAASYGDDQWSRQLDDAFGAVFEHDVRVFTVASGTAANAIALSCLAPPGRAILCHREAHIERDECGAPEFYSGSKLALLDGVGAKISATAIQTHVDRADRSVHAVRAATVSISQTTERGAVYSVAEIEAIGKAAREARLGLHMDGARLANAVAALGCSPAAMTWQAGVDVLSFGATKNGAMMAEAIVCFDAALGEEIARRRKRGGHLICKGRYPAAQFVAYFKNELWLRLARRANDLAQRLGEAAGSLLAAPVESNQVFIRLDSKIFETLQAASVDFYAWGERGDEARFVVSWNQSEKDVEAMRVVLASLR